MAVAGVFADGLTARLRPVQVQPGARGLRLMDGPGLPLAEWDYAGLRLAEVPQPGKPARLLHRLAGEATLTLDFDAWQRLLQESPALRRRFAAPRAIGRRWAAGVAAVLATGLVLAALAWSFPYLAGAIAPWVPRAWQRELGQQALQELATRFPLCDGPSDAAGLAALQGLTQRLAAAAQPPGTAEGMQVRVADAPIPNALALPGGTVLVFRDMLRTAHGPDELAGVLAHEVAHGLRRHPEQAWLRATGFELLARAVLGESGSAFSPRLVQALLLLRYTRSDEAEADLLGAQLLDRAGLPHGGLAALLARIRNAGGEGPAFLSAHPLTDERLAALRRLGPDKKELAPALSPRAWSAVQALCAGRHVPARRT